MGAAMKATLYKSDGSEARVEPVHDATHPKEHRTIIGKDHKVHLTLTAAVDHLLDHGYTTNKKPVPVEASAQ